MNPLFLTLTREMLLALLDKADTENIALRADLAAAREEIARLRAKLDTARAPELTGMKVSLRGMAAQSKNWMIERIHSHAQEMADRFYAGDFSGVDEFCQLYCLDSKRDKLDEQENL